MCVWAHCKYLLNIRSILVTIKHYTPYSAYIIRSIRFT